MRRFVILLVTFLLFSSLPASSSEILSTGQVLTCHDSWQQRLRASIRHEQTACEKISRKELALAKTKEIEEAIQKDKDDKANDARQEKWEKYKQTDAYKSIVEANSMHDGKINVETFTPNYMIGNKAPQWNYIGSSTAQDFWYMFSAKNYVTYLSVKVATKGIDEGTYTGLEFVSGEMVCPKNGYPFGLENAHTTIHNPITGIEISDDIEINRFGSEIPAVKGTVFASAIIGACDDVVKYGGSTTGI